MRYRRDFLHVKQLKVVTEGTDEEVIQGYANHLISNHPRLYRVSWLGCSYFVVVYSLVRFWLGFHGCFGLSLVELLLLSWVCLVGFWVWVGPCRSFGSFSLLSGVQWSFCCCGPYWFYILCLRV